MAITFVGSATGSAADAADFDITLPTCQEDDIVIITVSLGSQTDNTLGVSTSGYVELVELHQSDFYHANLSVSWKRMGAIPDTIVTCVNNGGALNAVTGIAYVLRGVDTTTAFDVTSTTATGGNSAIPDPPSITPVTNGALIIICGGSPIDDGAVTVPTGYSNHAVVSQVDTVSANVAMASKAWAGGADNPAAWTDWSTSTNHSWAAVTMALRPAGTGSINVSIGNASITLIGYAPIANLNDRVSVGNASLIVTGYSPSIAWTENISIPNVSIILTGQGVSLGWTYDTVVSSGEIIIDGFGPRVFIWGSVPSFEIAELVPNPEPGAPHDPCGHWHDGQSDDPVWDFTEQEDLPIPYHKHLVKPKVCGHWHKDPITLIPCIEYVGEIQVSFTPNTSGLYTSGDAMLYHTDGYIYGGAFSNGTIFRVEPEAFIVDIQTTFSASDISAIEQILYYDSYLYVMIKRSSYTGNWIQKISIPTDTTEDFELVGDPLYAGSVVTGTDGNIYGSFKSLAMSGGWYARHTPITGDLWATGWERLPDDYSYDVGSLIDYSGIVTSGADLINFRIIPKTGYIFVNGPTSDITASSAFIHQFEFDGTYVKYFPNLLVVGPNEIVMSPDSHNFALLRCTSSFTNLTMRRIDTNSALNSDYLITGLLDEEGNSKDNSIYHKRTVWHPANNLIYSYHSMYSDWDNRIIAVDSSGNLIHQYAWLGDTITGSFVILGDYVYVWQDGLTGSGHTSAIIKLTLELEFVCIEDCLGGYYNNQYREEGRQIVTDNEQYIYNFARTQGGASAGLITKWRVDPVVIGFDVHDPVWEFTKQWDKF